MRHARPLCEKLPTQSPWPRQRPRRSLKFLSVSAMQVFPRGRCSKKLISSQLTFLFKCRLENGESNCYMLVPKCICCRDVSTDKREILELVAIFPVMLLVKELFALVCRYTCDKAVVSGQWNHSCLLLFVEPCVQMVEHWKCSRLSL